MLKDNKKNRKQKHVNKKLNDKHYYLTKINKQNQRKIS